MEVAPRFGLADAIVDLNSPPARCSPRTASGRWGRSSASQAALVRAPGDDTVRADEIDRLSTMVGAVLEARKRKYLMMNAQASMLATLEALLPGLAGPSVIPLAHEGMIAIHAVVGADDVWDLLPRVKSAGATGILVVPIEKLIA